MIDRATKLFLCCLPFGLAPVGFAWGNPDSAGGKQAAVLLLVDRKIHALTQRDIQVYADDLRRDGYATKQVVGNWSDGFKVRDTLRRHFTRGLQGAVLIGSVPIPRFQGGQDPRPCLLALMDLDGRWKSSPDGTCYVATPPWPDIAPEIWVGVLAPNASHAGTVQQLRGYFRKLHAYRRRPNQGAGKALAFLAAPWGRLAPLGLDRVYPGRVLTITGRSRATADHLRKELSRGYEFIGIASHNNGGFAGLGLEGERDGIHGLTSTDILRLKPPARFYHLFSCSLCCPSKKDYFGGSLLFSGGALLVHGSSMPGGMNDAALLYQQWRTRDCFGEALKDWYRHEIPRDKRATDRRWYLGAIALGDPTLAYPGR